MIKIVAFLALAIGRLCCFEPYQVTSESMQPGLQPGDIVVIRKLSFGRIGSFGLDLPIHTPRPEKLPEPGSLVLFRSPVVEGQSFLARVVGRPGDTVELNAHTLIINGEQVSHPPATCIEMHCHVHDEIGATRFIAVYRNPAPLQRANGHWQTGNGWFVLGDHRDNSLDSRYFGSISTQNILGTMLFKTEAGTFGQVSKLLGKLFQILP